MTTVQIELPDELAKKAQELGLFTEPNIQQVIEAAVRHEAGRKLLEIIPVFDQYPLKDDGTPMNEDELMDMINSDVKAVRAQMREQLRAKGQRP